MSRSIEDGLLLLDLSVVEHVQHVPEVVRIPAPADHNGHCEPATPEEIRNILREVAETPKETDRRMRETDDLFNSPWERLVESLAKGDLENLLSQRGIAVDHSPLTPDVEDVARTGCGV